MCFRVKRIDTGKLLTVVKETRKEQCIFTEVSTAGWTHTYRKSYKKQWTVIRVSTTGGNFPVSNSYVIDVF